MFINHDEIDRNKRRYLVTGQSYIKNCIIISVQLKYLLHKLTKGGTVMQVVVLKMNVSVSLVVV